MTRSAFYCFIALVASCHSFDGRRLNEKNQLKYEAPRSHASLKRGIVAGRYLGFLKLREKNVKIPVVLELIDKKTRRKKSDLMLSTTFKFGGFDSEIFESFTFKNVVFDHNSKRLKFNKAERNLRFVKAKLMGGTILSAKLVRGDNRVGSLMAIYSGPRKSLAVARHLRTIYPQARVLPRLAGAYLGQCGGEKKKLQIETVRWQEGRQKDLFSSQRIRAIMSHNRDESCEAFAKVCVEKKFSDGNYDYLGSKLSLGSGEQALQCEVDSTTLNCGDCTLALNRKIRVYRGLKKVISRLRRVDPFVLSAKDKLPAQPDYAGRLAGEYYGYLFNETTGFHHFLRLKVHAEMVKEDGMKKATPVVSGVATLFFGKPETNEFVVYRFRPDYYSNSSPHFVFDGKTESFVQVSSWHTKGLRGIWYSKTSGRVGSIELYRDNLPLLSASARLINPISGSYFSNKSRLNLLASSDLSFNENIFFPLPMRGIASRLGNKADKKMIKKFSYDFFRGIVSFELEDGTLVSGHSTENGFDLLWPKNNSLANPILARQRESFRYQKDPLLGVTSFQILDWFKAKPNKF